MDRTNAKRRLDSLFAQLTPGGPTDADVDAYALMLKLTLQICDNHTEARAEDMARWVPIEGGKKRLDLAGEATPEEIAQGQANVAEMVTTRQTPVSNIDQPWDPNSTFMASGQRMATRAEWERWKEANGKVEVSRRDIGKSPRGMMRQEKEARLAASIEKAKQYLHETGMDNPRVPFVPPPVEAGGFARAPVREAPQEMLIEDQTEPEEGYIGDIAGSGHATNATVLSDGTPVPTDEDYARSINWV